MLGGMTDGDPSQPSGGDHQRVYAQEARPSAGIDLSAAEDQSVGVAAGRRDIARAAARVSASEQEALGFVCAGVRLLLLQKPEREMNSSKPISSIEGMKVAGTPASRDGLQPVLAGE